MVLNSSRKNNLLAFAAFFALATLIHANHLLNADEGYVLSVAWDIYNGKKLYTDIFAFAAPGAFYLIAGIWKIFGPSYFAARIAGILAISFSAWGISKISSRFTNKQSAFLCGIFFIFTSAYWPLISYHIFNLALIIWAFYFSLSAVANKRLKIAALSGFFIGISALFLQHTSIIAFSALFAFFLLLAILEKSVLRIKQSFALCVGALSAGVGIFLFWPPKLLWQNLILFPAKNYESAAAVPFVLLSCFLALVPIAALILKKEMNREYAFLLFFQTMLFLSAYSLADHFHIIKFTFPLIALSPVLFASAKKHIFLWRLNAYGAIFLSAFLIVYPSLLFLLVAPPLNNNRQTENAIKKISAICADSEYIYSGPFLPNFYFELRKKNPSPHHWLITNHHTPDQFNEALRGLKEHQPSCAILNYKIVEKYNYEKNNPVDNYIKENYNQIESIGNLDIYSLK